MYTTFISVFTNSMVLVMFREALGWSKIFANFVLYSRVA